jgi:hypothetical protein
MTAANPELDVQRLCRPAGLPRASYYRSIADDGDETRDHVMQEAIQSICLKHKYYGHRAAALTEVHHVFGRILKGSSAINKLASQVR